MLTVKLLKDLSEAKREERRIWNKLELRRRRAFAPNEPKAAYDDYKTTYDDYFAAVERRRCCVDSILECIRALFPTGARVEMRREDTVISCELGVVGFILFLSEKNDRILFRVAAFGGSSWTSFESEDLLEAVTSLVKDQAKRYEKQSAELIKEMKARLLAAGVK